MASTDAEKLGTSAATGFKFSFEEKSRSPNKVIFDVSTKSWDLAPPDHASKPTTEKK